MKELQILDVIGGVADDLVLEAKEAPRMNAKNPRPLRIALIAAIVAVVFAITAAAIFYSRSTEQLAHKWAEAGIGDPAIGEEIEVTAEQLAYIESRTMPLDQSATDSGITVNLETMTCMEHEVIIPCTAVMTEDCTLPYKSEDVMLVPDLQGVYWNNPAYGRIQGQRDTGGPSEFDLLGWGAVPNDANFCDGQTMLEVKINMIHVLPLGGSYSNELAVVEGAWNFTIPIPEMEAETKCTVDPTPIEEAFGLRNTEFQITSAGLCMTATGNYGFHPRMYLDRLDADLDGRFAVEVYLRDGAKIPEIRTDAEEKDGCTEFVMTWVPIDPTTIDHITVFDGETETEIDLPLIINKT